jgi:heme/copper-type cytochrome/quinol oxidase subunit 2
MSTTVMVIIQSVCMKLLQLQISTQSQSYHILLHSFLHMVKHLREFIIIIIVVIVVFYYYYYSLQQNRENQQARRRLTV